MSAVPPPPWQGRPQEPERTPEGEEIIRSRYGSYIRRPDGLYEPWPPSEIKLTRPQRPNPTRDWSPWDY